MLLLNACLLLLLLLWIETAHMQKCGGAVNENQLRIQMQGPPGKRGPEPDVNYRRITKMVLDEVKEDMEEVIRNEIDNSVDKIRSEMKKEMGKTPSQIGVRLPTSRPKDCTTVVRKDAKIRQSRGGVFDIYPESRNNSVEVYCDLETDGGGWTVFQRRMDGSVDFYREWEEYAAGFGDKDKEMWLGLETIYQLTKGGGYELRVDLTDWEENMAYAKYGQFSISGRSDRYRLTVRQYSGDAGDALYTHNGRQFSTFDADYHSSSINCAERWRGGWWYEDCHQANLNGIYYDGPVVGSKGVTWRYWKDSHVSLQIVEMKFRKK